MTRMIMTVVVWCMLIASAPAEELQHVSMAPRELDVLDRADVLVVDGTLAGCACALELARRGKDVVLASADSSMPPEFVVSLRPWLAKGDSSGLPEDLRSLVESCVKNRDGGGEAVVDVGKLAEGIEDLLVEAKARFYYGATPCGIVRRGRDVGGVIFGGKFGIQAIEAPIVIDTTRDARVAALAGLGLLPRHAPGEPVEMALTLRCDGNSVPDKAMLEEAGAGRVRLHGPFVEFRIRIAVDLNNPLYPSAIALHSRKALFGEVTSLVEKRGRMMRLRRVPDDVWIEPLVRIRSQRHDQPPRAEPLKDLQETVQRCRPAGVQGLWICSPAVDLPNPEARMIAESGRAVPLAVAVARTVLTESAQPAQGRSSEPSKALLSAGDATDSGKGASARSEGSRDRVQVAGALADVQIAVGDAKPLFGPGATISSPATPVPVATACDVLVVGGGTSGFAAAWAAAGTGCQTILLEKHTDLGGTQTIGGVADYWYGRKTEFVERLDRSIAPAEALGLPRALGILNELGRRGVTVLPKCLAVGTLVEEKTIVGAVLATPRGLRAVRAKVVIDATGDGDLAAWSGAEYVYGTGRDAMTLWCSFGEFKSGGSNVSRQYDSMVDVRDAADMTRAMLTGRRRPGIFGAGEFPQHYLTPRESRHILGGQTITYGGILAGQGFSDLVLLCRSNFDIKGMASSDLVGCGFVTWNYTENFTAAVPYAALVPKDRENLLVVGKAYSATHDALSLARMQRDLMAMGGVAGLAAAMAVDQRTPVSRIDVARLRAQLLAAGILTDQECRTYGSPRRPSDEEIANLAAEAAAGKLDLPGKVRLLMEGERARTVLARLLPGVTDEAARIDIARGLCYLGDRSGVPFLLESIRKQTRFELPERRKPANLPPDHGWAPEPAYSIYAVGLTGDRRLAPVLAELAPRIKLPAEKPDVSICYVLAICQAAERIGSPELVPSLKVLARKPNLRGRLLPYGSSPRRSVSILAEPHAYLELSVARALARCGDAEGYNVLIDYLGDMRGCLARSAHDELSALSGKDFGQQPEGWRTWLESHRAAISPQPYRRRLD